MVSFVGFILYEGILLVTSHMNWSVLFEPVISPTFSMYGIFTYICPNNHPNVGKYTIHGAYGSVKSYNCNAITGWWFQTWLLFSYFMG